MNCLKKVEYTTQNLYSHDNASIYSIDSSNSMFLTAGGDKNIILWNLQKENEEIKKIMGPNEINHENVKKEVIINEAHQTTVKIVFNKTYEKHTKSINCVRFNKNGKLFASCSDGGEIIIWFDNETVILKEPDSKDIYEICWGDNFLFAGTSNGRLHLYEITYNDKLNENETKKVLKGKLIQTIKAHSDIIQGMCYNEKYKLLVTASKDRSYKIFFMDKKLNFVDKIDVFNNEKIFSDDANKILFRRPSFSFCGKFLYLISGIQENSKINENFVYILHYPFRGIDFLGKIGPLETPSVKMICSEKYNLVVCKKNIYVCNNVQILFMIKNASFFPLTDGCQIDNAYLFSSLDGFLYSLKIE